MLSNVKPIRPAPQFSPGQLAAIAGAASAMVNAGLQILDVLGGDPDGELSGDEQGFLVAGWTIGRHGTDHDDAEVDDPGESDDPLDSSDDEGEPDFRPCKQTAVRGLGCLISDPNYGAEEAGEPEARNGH